MLKKHTLINLLFLSPIIVLIFLKNYDYYWDGVDIAYYLNNPTQEKMFHQHHLLFAPLCYAIFFIITKIGLTIRSIDFLIWLNVLAGICFLMIVYLTLNQLFPSFQHCGTIGALIIGVSYIYGTYFRNSDQYIIPITICSLIIYYIIKHLKESGELVITIREWLLLLLAIMLHQMALFILPAFMYADFILKKDSRFKRVIVHVSILLFSIFVLYLLIFSLRNPTRSFSDFIDWAVGYGKKDFWVFKEDRFGVPVVNLSIAEGLLSGKALFIAPIDRYSVLRLHEFTKLYGNGTLGEILGWFLFGVIIALIIFGFRNMISGVKFRKIAIFLAIWCISLLLFLQVFSPYACFYRLFCIFPLVIFMIAGVSSVFRTEKDIVAGVLILGIFLYTNFAFGFIPESVKANNPYLTFANYIKENTTKRDFFIIPLDDYFYVKYMRYFSDRDVAWDKPFNLKMHPELSSDKIDTITATTKKWLLENYDNIYIYRVTSIPKTGYILLLPLSRHPDTPQFLVLNIDQIYYSERINFLEKTFHVMKFSDYQYQ